VAQLALDDVERDALVGEIDGDRGPDLRASGFVLGRKFGTPTSPRNGGSSQLTFARVRIDARGRFHYRGWHSSRRCSYRLYAVYRPRSPTAQATNLAPVA
jgi:hypothetical protein